VINKIKTRLASEQGFTLIELLVVIIILGILAAIAVPAYMSFRGSAQDAAAKSNVRSAVPAAEEYYEQNSSYTSMTTSALQTLAPGVSNNVVVSVLGSGSTQGYCIDDPNEGNNDFYYIGGAFTESGYQTGTLTSGACPTS